MARAERKLPTKEEIAKLPRWAIVAFAARCARRVQPLFELCSYIGPLERDKKAVSEAIQFAEELASSGGKSLADDVDKAAIAAAKAEITADDAILGYFAVQAVARAAAAAKAALYVAQATAHAAKVYEAVQAAAECATYAAQAATEGATWAARIAAAEDAIIADFALLKKAAKKENWTNEICVPPEFFGPLWPDGEPDWEKIIAAQKKKWLQDEAVFKINKVLAKKVGQQKYRIWFKNTTKFTLRDDYLKVSVPNPFIANWIETHFLNEIHEAVRLVTGTVIQVTFTTDPELSVHMGQAREQGLSIKVVIPDSASEEKVTEELIDLFQSLNKYHIAYGGNGLTIEDFQTFVRDGVIVGVGQ